MQGRLGLARREKRGRKTGRKKERKKQDRRETQINKTNNVGHNRLAKLEEVKNIPETGHKH